MTAIEQAIKEAVEKGWSAPRPNKFYDYSYEAQLSRQVGGKFTLFNEAFLDPLFWQALGKARGWDENPQYWTDKKMPEWQYEWHRFIDYLAEGKDAESFFAELLR